jgi:hypothetical protein
LPAPRWSPMRWIGPGRAQGSTTGQRYWNGDADHDCCTVILAFMTAPKISIDLAESRALLESGQVHDQVQLLMLEIAVRLGRKTMTFGEIKQLALHAVATAGTTKTAVKALRAGN